MEFLWSTIMSLGGPAIVGGAIDLGMYSAEKQRLRALLEEWWLRFSYVSWGTFGRSEAELAVSILDRHAGSRLWSWKRWRFSICVVAAAFVLSIIWTLGGLWWAEAGAPSLPSGRLPFDTLLFDFVEEAMTSFWLGLTIVVFALSLSLTRLLSVTAARLAVNPATGIAAFTALLVIHLVLYAYWSELIVPAIIDLGNAALKVLIGAWPPDAVSDSWKGAYETIASPPPWSDILSFRWLFWTQCDFAADNPRDILVVTFQGFVNLVANGLRIVFALVFLASYLFQPLIQPLILRLWHAALGSRVPLFTLLFTGLGVIVGLVR
jgi:hypothetical protein